MFEKRYQIVYFLMFVFCILAQFSMLTWYVGLGWFYSISDALVSQSMLFIPMISLWYVVRFSKPADVMALRSLTNAQLAIIFFLAIYLYSSDSILRSLFPTEDMPLINKYGVSPIRLVTGFLTGQVILFYFLIVVLRTETKEAAKRELQLQTMMQQTELQVLKNQLNPHFIYNSLNAISSLTITSPAKAREMIIKLSDFLRLALKQNATQLTSLSQEIDTVKLYLQIEQVRFGDRLRYRFEIEEEHLTMVLPVLILQPLFENAIKHGIQKSGIPGEIVLTSSQNGKDIILSLTNPHDSKHFKYKGEGVGLENIRNRLRVFYGNGQLLRVRNEENHFIATLQLPAEKATL